MSKIVLHSVDNTTHSTADSGVEKKIGTILDGGNIPSSSPFRAETFKKMPLYGAKVTATTATPARLAKPFSAGTYAYVMERGVYLIRTQQTKLSGQTSNLQLNSGSDFARKLMHASSGDRRLAISGWDYVTGAATTGSNTGKRTEFGSDDEAYPKLSRALPGSFQYEEGKNLPTQLTYQSKT